MEHDRTTLQALDNLPIHQPIQLAHNLGVLKEMRARVFGLFMLPFVASSWLATNYWYMAFDESSLWIAMIGAGGGMMALLIYALYYMPQQMAQDPPMDIVLTHDQLTLVPHGLFGRREKDTITLAMSRNDTVVVRQARPDAPIADILLSCVQLLKPLYLGSNKIAVARQRAENLAQTLELQCLCETGHAT